jgi:endonuclease YncB( thermonuclease family)
MAKAIEQLRSGLTVGHAGLGLHGGGVGSVKQQVHDGDTVTVRAIGNISVRYLGIDAPEVSFTLPALAGDTGFVSIKDQRWTDFLSDPFGPDWRPMPALDASLAASLLPRFRPDTAPNHATLADGAQRKLEELIEADREAQGLSEEDFRFFLAFASEVMDRYGRLLCYINRDEPDEAQRPPSYNERLLDTGAVSPYFIFPNVDPFRRQPSTVAAVPAPGSAAQLGASGALGRARGSVKAARQRGDGIWASPGGLLLEAFELRFLAGRRPPNRWLIDLSQSGSMLIQPQRYHQVPLPEDRLWIPEELVPLFVEQGWQKQP